MDRDILPARPLLQTLSRLVARAMLFAAMTLVPLMAGLAPAHAENLSFAGTWDTQTDKGLQYDMVLKQHGNQVSGTFVERDNGTKGQITGSVSDNVLEFHWTEGEFSGDGQFALSADGTSFTGVYNADDNPKLTAPYQHGKWTGTRTSNNTGLAGGVADFSGFLSVESDKGWQYVFTIVQNGASVHATYIAANGGGIKDEGTMIGKVTGHTLKFRWQQGEFTGKGEFTLDADGSVTGTYSADPNTKLPPEFLSGTYTGHLATK